MPMKLGIPVEPRDISLFGECDGDLPIVLPAGPLGIGVFCTGMYGISSKTTRIRRTSKDDCEDDVNVYYADVGVGVAGVAEGDDENDDK
jgi:hypothetical protein